MISSKALTYGFLAIALAPFLSYAIGPYTTFYDAFTVSSGSMSPSIPKHSIIYTHQVPSEKLKEGDVITFESGEESFTTHRIDQVVENRSERMYRTKGDANEDVDPGLVSQNEVVGKVFLVLPVLGGLIMFAKSSAGIFLLVIVPAIALAGYEIISISKEVREP